MNLDIGHFDEACNPLDHVEDVLHAHSWRFERVNEDELTVQVGGKAGEYRLFFIWQEDMSALQFCCQYDMVIGQEGLEKSAAALMHMNENLWMGHFDIPRHTGVPSFRHTCLMRGMSGAEIAEDLVDIAMAQCERYYAVFHMLAQAGKVANDQDLSLALMDTSGEA